MARVQQDKTRHLLGVELRVSARVESAQGVPDELVWTGYARRAQHPAEPSTTSAGVRGSSTASLQPVPPRS